MAAEGTTPDPIEPPTGDGLREPPRARALPGELKPLTWSDERGPITDDEALGVLRRRRRVEAASVSRTGGDRAARGPRAVPDRLPAADAARQPTMFRLPPRLLARAHARAELEAVPLTTIVEELLAGYADGVPQEPSAVHDRLRAAGLKWQRR